MLTCERPACVAVPKAGNRFCSRRCAVLTVRHLGLQKAGRVTGQRARKARALKVMAQIEGLMPAWLLAELGTEARAAVKALMVRAFLEGDRIGYGRGWAGGKTKRAKDRTRTQAA